MELLYDYFLPCFWAFVACAAFGVLFDIHGKGIIFTSLGGALGWLVYLLCYAGSESRAISAFAAGVVISLFSEVMARVRKCPSSGYLLIAFFPLVPGAGLYYTMEHFLNGDTAGFQQAGYDTLAMAGGLALGVLLVSSMVRMLRSPRRMRHCAL